MSITPFTPDDLAALDALPPDVRAALMARLRWHISTPYALAMKEMNSSGSIMGLATAVAHQGSGWLGASMALTPDGPATGNGLLDALLNELQVRGCRTVYAIAEAETHAKYARRGFVHECDYLRYAGGRCAEPPGDEVELCEPRHTLGILHLDRSASGEDRRELVIEHLYFGRIHMEQGRVHGCYLPLLGDGLILADRPEAGEELLRWHLPHVEGVWLPEGNATARAFLEQRGYCVQERRMRMRLGDALAWQPAMLYGWIGETLG